MEASEQARKQARKRVKKKKNFQKALLTYVVVNAFFVVIWALGDGGYFWPVWVIAGWGIGMVFMAWNAYGNSDEVTEADIDRELKKTQA